MTAKTTNLPLASEIAPATFDDWLEAASKSLRGRSLADLTTETLDGITIDVLYERSTNNADSLGLFPYTRSGTRFGNSQGGWEIRQCFNHPDPDTTNKQILDELNRGVTEVHLSLSPSARSLQPLNAETPFTGEGLEIYALNDLQDTLNGVYLNLARISFSSGAAFISTAEMMQSLWASNSLSGNQCHASFNADPIGTFGNLGSLPYTLEDGITAAAKLALHTATHYQQSTSIAVDTTIHHNNGASEAQELACMLATGRAYLQALLEAGLSINDACRQIEVYIATDTDYFMSTAKLRVARTLWAKMTSACGATGNAQVLQVCAMTSRRMLSVYDPWVNILRTTVAAAAAALGGTNSLMVDAFDSASGPASKVGRRIARNIPAILMAESNMHKVVDPMGGSGFIEHITCELCEKAWATFQLLEKSGGMVPALNNNIIQDLINESHERRIHKVIQGEQPLVGVSEFPLLDESAVEPDAALIISGKKARLAALKNAAQTTPSTTNTPNEKVTAMPVRRLAQPFESIRTSLDNHTVLQGKRPTIFIASLGEPADYLPRCQFTKNLLASGGIGTTTPDGTLDTESVIKEFKRSELTVAAICVSKSTDHHACVELAQSLKKSGAKKVLYAGLEPDKSSGEAITDVDLYVFRGCNIVAALQFAATSLGVTQ